jgi:SpoVK/Ycf46/Vps4 family AAA+-type ATPase
LAGRAEVTRKDIVEASWTSEGAGLSSLAEPLTDPIPDEAFIMTPDLQQQMYLLKARCRRRDQLASSLGISATSRYRPGVRALLVGPSGTGKTLAAGWLATQLGIPLYRVDLASVTSKFIGETEKNLSQLLARAEQSELVLLFDEADSLFGKRTDVKDANDRFANAQTNYLLQRLESFDGITLLTSNSRSRFDPAFFRRLDVIVDFASPGPEERRLLWQSHLGASHQLSQRELNQLAANTSELCGGHIRNAVLSAATLCASTFCGDNGGLRYEDVLEGLSVEFRKLGKQMPIELSKL